MWSETPLPEPGSCSPIPRLLAMEIEGQVVVVTGAASGIGEALARACLAAGAEGVAGVDLDTPGLERLGRELGAGFVPITADVSDPAQVGALVGKASRELGPIGIYCSNAGISSIDDVTTDPEVWQRAWDVNLMSHVHAAASMVPIWSEGSGGHLVITASAAGLLMMPWCASYTVTKHAAVGLAEWIAAHHGAAGVGVSVLCPQGVRTAMTADLGEDGGPVGGDGMLEPDVVADHVISGIRNETFQILPHPEVKRYAESKARDPERWLARMSKVVGGFADFGSTD